MQGQVAHLDHDRTNNVISNLAYMCLPHHDQYDSEPSQSRALTRSEVELYISELLEYNRALHEEAWPDSALKAPRRTQGSAHRSRPIPVEVYQLRIKVYRDCIAFLNTATNEPEVPLEKLLAFARATDETLFLFDQAIADYVAEIYRKAVQLRSVNQRLAQAQRAGVRDDALIDQDSTIVNWLAVQYEGLRIRLVPYLRLS